MVALTKAEARVFKFVERHIRYHGYSPSYRDIMEGLKYKSVSHVYRMAKRVEMKGKIKITPRQPNGIEVMPTCDTEY